MQVIGHVPPRSLLHAPFYTDWRDYVTPGDSILQICHRVVYRFPASCSLKCDDLKQMSKIKKLLQLATPIDFKIEQPGSKRKLQFPLLKCFHEFLHVFMQLVYHWY